MIDSMWSSCRAYVPNSLPSCSPHVLLYVKSWQWRYVLRQRDVEQQTVVAIAKMLERRRQGMGDTICVSPQRNAKRSKTEPSFSEVFWGRRDASCFREAAIRERGVRSAGLFLFLFLLFLFLFFLFLLSFLLFFLLLFLALGCSAAPSRRVTFDVALLAISHTCHAGNKSQFRIWSTKVFLSHIPRHCSCHILRSFRRTCYAHVAQMHPCLAHGKHPPNAPCLAHDKHTRPRACCPNAPMPGTW